jgi:hypothetical protein
MSASAMRETTISEKGAERRIGRSIGAVLAGMIASIVLSLGTDVLLHMVRVFPPWGASMVGYDGALLLATFYRTIYGVVGSYIAARLAPNRPMLHAIVLGTLGFTVSIFGAVATWNGGPAFGPHWYPVVLVVLALPTAWVGGRVRLAQVGQRSAL